MQNSTSNGGVAGRLVDGNHTPYFGNDAFLETEAGSLLWELDIGAKFYVTLVTITTHADNYWVTNKFSILCFGYVSTYWRNNYMHILYCKKVEKRMLARISFNGSTTRLSL